jgi:hypothetical protein
MNQTNAAGETDRDNFVDQINRDRRADGTILGCMVEILKSHKMTNSSRRHLVERDLQDRRNTKSIHYLRHSVVVSPWYHQLANFPSSSPISKKTSDFLKRFTPGLDNSD